eukprot:CAMPEP_0119506332 /NCGR_PEP_ID=MMETSP1344-20130328/26589_1 /TAXON_ID=236787 /ORGANISM="Florenciella parvula, Strain CCMP2471" /LENGTH=57 /DNA_ID=CAMNT_0007542861 /DNA_START=6 /DNA_END=176 /DNA_ORIENTATION=-
MAVGRDPFILLEHDPAYKEATGWIEMSAQQGNANAGMFLESFAKAGQATAAEAKRHE